MSELRVGSPVTIGEVSIIPVERVRVYSNKMSQGYWLYGLKEPVAMVISDPQGVKAVDMQACELSLSELVRDAPDLEAILAGFHDQYQGR